MSDETIIKEKDGRVGERKKHRVLTKIKEGRIVKGGYFSAPTTPRPQEAPGAQNPGKVDKPKQAKI